MSMYTFDNTIPAADNDPSADQPLMLSNNVANQGIWTEDHVGFNANNGGTHLQNRYSAFSSGNLISGTQSSTVYPAAGVASASNAQYYFKNPLGNFLLSGIRAYALIDGNGNIINNQKFNINTVVKNSAGNYTITLTTNSTSSADYAVFAQPLYGVPDAVRTIKPIVIDASTVQIIIGSGNDNVFCIIVYQI